MVVLQQNTTEFRWGTVIEDNKILYESVGYLQDKHEELIILEKNNQWLGVLGNTYGVEAANLSNHRVLRT